MRWFADLWEAAVMAQDTSDMWEGHKLRSNASSTNPWPPEPWKPAGLILWSWITWSCNARGLMIQETKRPGRMVGVRIFHHRTRAMKARKMFCSVTDWPTIREIGLKALGRLRG